MRGGHPRWQPKMDRVDVRLGDRPVMEGRSGWVLLPGTLKRNTFLAK